MQYNQITACADQIFERTHAGQCEMLTHEVELDDFERRLLGILTGFTSLGDIMQLLGEAEIPQSAIQKLLAEGLIQPHEAKRSEVNKQVHLGAWRAAHGGQSAGA
jgi:hypothetical protein